MNLAELANRVNKALADGISPACTVVLDDGGESPILDEVILPSEHDDYIFVTLRPSATFADERFNPCHYGQGWDT